MHVLNAAKSSDYFDTRIDEREDGAVHVIHAAWLEHSRPLGRLEHLEPAAPLDMLILYQAAAATFKDGMPNCSCPEALSPGGRITNREQAKQRLQSVPDPELAVLATRYANNVIALSESAANEQDLNYFVELFLCSLQDRRTLEGILSGEISRHAKRPWDGDLW